MIGWASAGPVFTPEVQGLSASHWARTYLPEAEREAALASLWSADQKKLPPSGKIPQRTRSKGSGGTESAPVEDLDWGWVPLYDDRKTEIVLIGVDMVSWVIKTTHTHITTPYRSAPLHQLDPPHSRTKLPSARRWKGRCSPLRRKRGL